MLISAAGIASFLTLLLIISSQQDIIVKRVISSVNQNLTGEIRLQDSHISFFETFPRITIDLEDLELYENRNDSLHLVVHLQDLYLNFKPLALLQGRYEVRELTLSGGYVNILEHADSTLNILNIFKGDATTNSPQDSASVLNIGLEKITLKNMDIIKRSETSGLLVESFIEMLESGISYTPEHILFSVKSNMLLNIIDGLDTTFFHDKHLTLSTSLDYTIPEKQLSLAPSMLKLESGEFNIEGQAHLNDDGWIDLRMESRKKNFDIVTAFLPPEIVPAFERYDNGGEIYLFAQLAGPMLNGKLPGLYADFGCKEAFVSNKSSQTQIGDLYFEGSFTAESLGNLSTMRLEMKDFTARPEAGNFSGLLSVTNFDSPDIEMQLRSEFNLNFLAEFFELKNLKDLTGDVAITMNFHDIIDLDQPEKSIGRLNESYFTDFSIRNLSFTSPDFHLPIENLNLSAKVEGHEARIDELSLRAGNSDIRINASISDLPAIIHHTDLPIEVKMNIFADTIDLKQLTITQPEGSSGINEQIENLELLMSFKSSARAITESPYLPLGEFYVDQLQADLKNYPHRLHDFHADILIDSVDFRVIDFTGMLDASDFHFDGRLSHYDLWFQDNPKGDTRVEFSLESKLLRLEDLFTYGGENFVPEDYRHEEVSNMNIRAFAELHFDSLITSADVNIEDVNANMKIHPLRFERFGGRIHIEDQMLDVQDIRGRLGNSDFSLSYSDVLGNSADTASLNFQSAQLDFDQLFNYTPPPLDYQMTPQDHEEVFNVFDVPFGHLRVNADIKKLNYHRYLIEDFHLNARMQPDHFIYLDSLSLRAANGSISGNGYFNGSNPERIYLQPNLTMQDMEMEKLLFKFENFGQDYLVSDNISGRLSADISGKIHVHPDLVPILDDSDLTMKIEVINGQLKRYALLDVLSDYFRNKNLNQVRFDTLRNELSFSQGSLNIPKMNINTSLGYFEIRGRQSITDYSMDYTVGVPVKTITEAVRQRLFMKDQQISEDQVDAIIYRDETRKTAMVNVRVTGTPDSYEVELGEK